MRHSGRFSIENAEHDPYSVSLMKIAPAQFNPTVGDFEGKRARIRELARTAKSSGAGGSKVHASLLAASQ
jgi:hypothetical protein